MEIVTHKVLDFINLLNQSFIGEKIKTSINPRIIESNIGFKRKNDKTKSMVIKITVTIFLK